MKLRIVDEIVEMVARVHRLALVVGRQDKDLARQMRRSSASVGLNAGEGLSGRDGNRSARLESAMCSGRETIFALRIAAPPTDGRGIQTPKPTKLHQFGYLGSVDRGGSHWTTDS